MRVPKKAMVLAAGLGTRLGALSEHAPKPAIPLCGLSPLRLTLARLAAAGVEEVMVNTHWLPEVIGRELDDAGRETGLRLQRSHEPELLGTGGGLRKVRAWVGEGPLLVMNGKLVHDAELEALAAAHDDELAATMLLRPLPEGAPWGAVGLDGAGRVGQLAGYHAPAAEGPLRDMVFTGVHLISASLLDRLPPEGPSCVIRQGYLPAMQAGEGVRGVVEEGGFWGEPSTPARYLETLGALLGGEVPLARFRAGGADPLPEAWAQGPGVWVAPDAQVDPEATLTPPVWIGPKAVIAAASLGPGVAIEAGAQVGAGARLQGCSVWPGAVVAPGAQLEGQVVLPGPPAGAPESS